MSNITSLPLGTVTITGEALAQLAYKAASECFGVVGLSAKNLSQLLTGENRGIKVTIKDHGVLIQIQIFVLYGTKISEIARNISEGVRYSIEQYTGMKVEQVEIKIAGIKVAD